jgi:late competence protein required for DNA uptake (superfamily II DNA/RNA helicase)
MEIKKYSKGISIAFENNIISYAWINNGSLSISSLLKKEEIPKEENEFIKYVIENIIDEEKVVCSGCGEIIDKVYGRHFAGVYCKNCWENYKKEKKEICHLCGRPYYDCTC